MHLKKVMTASTVQLRTDALSESPSEVTRLQRKGYILMQPFNFRISSQSAFSEKEFSLGFGPFSCFLREERKEKGRQLEANRDAQRDTEGETSNKKLQRSQEPHQIHLLTLSQTRGSHPLNTSQFYFSNMLFGGARSEGVGHYRRTRQSGWEAKHSQCSTAVASESSNQDS